MPFFRILLLLAGATFFAPSAHAQSQVRLCVMTSSNVCTPVTSAAGLPVNIVAGSGSGCAGTVGTPCIVSQATAANLNMTEANSAAILAAATSAIPAGTAIIGKVGIDQTTPGTTNAVSVPTVTGTKAAGTAAASSLLAGGVYNSTPPTLTDGQQAALQLGPHGGLLLGGAGYPSGATPITISGTGTTGATTATLATGASVTTYLCGFSIRANATAAATGNATVTGTITGTLNYTQWTAPNASGLGVTEQIFTPCIPASAVNTGIAVISAAPGTGGVVSVTAWGFTL